MERFSERSCGEIKISVSFKNYFKFEFSMPKYTETKKEFEQLQEVLQNPIIELQLDNPLLTIFKTRTLIKAKKNCCIVSKPSKSHQKIYNIITLHRSMAMLKKIRRQIIDEYPLSNGSLIGIYPSIQYPACVYELHTSADSYVTENVLPYDGSILIAMIKYLIGKVLGVNPSVGGLGLLLYRE